MNKPIITLMFVILFAGLSSTIHARWIDPNWSSSVVIYDLASQTNSQGKVQDVSCMRTNSGILPGGSASPLWIESTNGIHSYYLYSGSNYITVPNNTLLNEREQVTFAVWANITNVATANPLLFAVGNSPTGGRTNGMQVLPGSPYPVVSLCQGNADSGRGWQTGVSNALGVEDNWNFYVGTIGNDGRIYLNGRQVISSGSGNGSFSMRQDGPMMLGRDSSGQYHNGGIGWAGVYVKELASNEVWNLYWNTATNYGLSKWSYRNPSQWSNEILELTMGGTVQDWGPYENNGSITNITYTNGTACFNGSNSKITFPTNTAYTGGTYTFSFWVKSTVTNLVRTLWYSDGSSGADRLVINWADSAKAGHMTIWDGATTNRLGVPPGDGTWHHIGLVLNGSNSTLQLYKDGVLTTNTTYKTNGQKIGQSIRMIGASNNVSFFSGSLDHFRIFNRAFSSNEVAALRWEEWPEFGQSWYMHDNPSVWSNTILSVTFDARTGQDYSPGLHPLYSATGLAYSNGAAVMSGSSLAFLNSVDWDLFASTATVCNVSLWFKKSSDALSQGLLAHGATYYWSMYTHETVGYRFLGTVGAGTVIDSGWAGSVPIDNEWHHYAVVKQGRIYGEYLDGVQIDYVVDNDVLNNNGILAIGNNLDLTTPFDGLFDDVLITTNNWFNANPTTNLTDTITVPTRGMPGTNQDDPLIETGSVFEF